MRKKIFILLITALIITKALDVYAFENGTLSGRIIDGFGNPVPLADIQTNSGGTKAKASTDFSGNYTINYSPGNINFSITASGYVPMKIPFMIEEITDLALDDITVWKIPPQGGLFVVGENDYIEINRAEYYSDSSSKEKRFYVKGKPKQITGLNLKIIDFQTDNPLVVGKTLYRVDRSDSIGSVIFYPSQKYALNKIEDTYSRIADNVGLRSVSLSPGKYFYCTGEVTIRSRVGYGFYFEVSS